jgi:O-acetyl-ADP-ribose deacetylase
LGPSLSIPPITVTIVEGDITAQTVDAIVNAANNMLWMGSGVAGAIKKRGGSSIEWEAVKQGPIAKGDAIVTSAGTLPMRCVIHAAVMGPTLRTNADLIGRATRSALDRAREQQVASIAFPALGTGVGGFPIAECAKVMLQAVRDHAASQPATTVREVRFVLFGQEAFQTFVSAAEGL